MTIKNANTLSFTRLSFAAEELLRIGSITDKAPRETPTTTFRSYMDTRYSTIFTEHESLRAQVLLAQVAQESDE